MSEFYPEIEIRPEQAEAMAHGLFAVARADGHVHEREAALIVEFFTSAAGRPSSLGALERAPKIEADTLAGQLPGIDLRILFIKTALLLAYTDSLLGPGEAEVINEYAAAMEVTRGEIDVLSTQVKEFLLEQLSHLHNVDAAVQVARKLNP